MTTLDLLNSRNDTNPIKGHQAHLNSRTAMLMMLGVLTLVKMWEAFYSNQAMDELNGSAQAWMPASTREITIVAGAMSSVASGGILPFVVSVVACLPTSLAAAALPVTNGLVAYYPLTSGFEDMSGTNITTFQEGTAAIENGALSFDGSNGAVITGTFGLKSVMVQLFNEQPNGGAFVLGRSAYDCIYPPTWIMMPLPSNNELGIAKAGCDPDGSISRRDCIATSAPRNNWKHYGIITTATEHWIYDDRRFPIGGSFSATVMPSDNQSLYLANPGPNSNWATLKGLANNFKGRMRHLWLFDRALTAEEFILLEDYTSTTAPTASPAVAPSTVAPSTGSPAAAPSPVPSSPSTVAPSTGSPAAAPSPVPSSPSTAAPVTASPAVAASSTGSPAAAPSPVSSSPSTAPSESSGDNQMGMWIAVGAACVAAVGAFVTGVAYYLKNRETTTVTPGHKSCKKGPGENDIDGLNAADVAHRLRESFPNTSIFSNPIAAGDSAAPPPYSKSGEDDERRIESVGVSLR